jgi:hypothetical protein
MLLFTALYTEFFWKTIQKITHTQENFCVKNITIIFIQKILFAFAEVVLWLEPK